MNKIRIGNRQIGQGEPCYLVGEAGSNHNKSFETACRLVDIAVDAGVDAVKFQVFTADKIASKADLSVARIDFAGARTLHELYQKSELPLEFVRPIAEYCHRRNITFFSTPFDEDSVDYLDALGVPAFKVASFELVHIPLSRHTARKGKPMILSTGMATLGEIEEALRAVRDEGNDQVVLLHCAANYPARFENVNLRAMFTMQQAFQLPVGYSGHTPGTGVPAAVAALGGCMLEKHFTYDRNADGADHFFSLNPEELKQMVRTAREVEQALGSSVKGPAPDEAVHIQRGRRSLFAAIDIPAGTILAREMVSVLRPGVGIKPVHLELILGRVVRKDIPAGHPITWDLV